MSKQVPPPHQLDHLVSQGNVSGPRREHLWARVAPQVVARTAWWRRPQVLLTAFSGVALAAGMLLLVPSTTLERGVHLRGASNVAPPLLEATCGTATQPCRVGQSISFRLLPHAQAGVVLVTLGNNPRRALVGRLGTSTQPQVLPNTVTPEDADRATQLQVEAFWLPAAPEEKDLDGWLQQPTGTRSMLTLDVAP